MKSKLKTTLITVVGGFLTFIGAVFILVPGPAFLFLPIGLAILSFRISRSTWLFKAMSVLDASRSKAFR